MTNIWRREPLKLNPYYRTAFQALGITRDETSLHEIEAVIQDRLDAVECAPDLYRLGDEPLTPSDIVGAREWLFDPNKRALQALLSHRPEGVPTANMEPIWERLLDAIRGAEEDASLAFLQVVIQAETAAMVAEAGPVDVPPYPVDLALIPPFGVEENDHVG